MGVKDGCLIGGAHRRLRPIRCYYSTFIHLGIFEVHFDCAGSQNLVGAGGRSSRLFVARAVHELVVMVVAMKVVMMVVVMVMTVVSSHAGLPKLGGAPPSAPLLHSEAIPGQQF